MEDLEKDYQYFVDNKKILAEKYGGMYVVVSKCSVVNSFPDENEAYYFGIEQFGLGNFIVQLCTEDEDAHAQTFHSRVTFA